jgi:Winged helix-turn helix
MPKLLYARPAADAEEERKIRRLARSRHAPADWVMRAKMIAASWDGDRTRTIAARLGCHLQTVRERLARFDAEGVDGLGDRPGAGRKRRITEAQRGRIIALARSQPPGRPARTAGGDLHAGGCAGTRAVDPRQSGRGRPGRGDRGAAQPGAADPGGGAGALAAHPFLGVQ